MGSESARCVDDLSARFNAAEDLIAGNLAAGRGGKAAIVDWRGTVTYEELAEQIERMAGAFAGLGIAPGDRVLLCLLDTRNFPTVFLGAIKAGVIPAPLNTLLTTDDYHWLLGNSQARAVFVSDDLAHKWAPVAEANPGVRFISSEGGPWADLDEILTGAGPMAHAADSKPTDTAFWLYTSGSTGHPKAALHRHGSMRLTANLYGLGTAGMREDDVILSVAKQFFAYGLGNALTFPYAAGATVVLHRDRATTETIGALLVQHGVTVMAGVPTFFAGFLASEICPAKEDVPNLRLAISAGEALPAHLGEAFRERFGADILDGLGSTEMLHIFISQRPDRVHYGCTGMPVDGYKVRLVNDAGAEAAVGEIGNLHVCGPTSATGYWQDPAKSAATFQGEWTVSGDKYIRDADGWFTYAGRGDDMLKVGGIYVSPIEVEEALASHECVLEAAVIGAMDTAGLIKPHAYIVLCGDVEACTEIAELLKAHVKALLAPYKYPRWITFVDELPRTATGKIQRFRLREA